MKSFTLLILSIVVVTMSLHSDSHANTLFGKITDDSGIALPGAAISIPALQRGAVAESGGIYRIENLPHGVYTVQFSLIGYASETRTTHVEEVENEVNVALHVSPLSVGGISVTGTPQPLSILESPQPISIVDGRKLDRDRGETVMATLDGSPGVTLFTTGAAVSKPVIRGLTSQRVLVAANGVRQETQQWGDEHRPEIDAMNVERIEVVRGPASVLYGSDAIGGVVNVISREIPSSESGAPTLAGELTGNAFSNNSQGAGALALEGANGDIGYRANLGARSAGDTRTPDGELFNSALEELNGTGALGWRSTKGSAVIDYSHAGSRFEIHEDPAEDPEATPHLNVLHDRVQAHGLIPSRHARIELDAGWQRNNLREFEEEGAETPAVDLVLKTATSDLKVHHHPAEILNGTAGLSVVRQTNESLAEEKLIPDLESTDFAGFLYEEIRLKQLTISAGFRGDTRTLDVTESPGLGVGAQSRDYSAFTANGGLAWMVAPGAALTASVGRAWRAPTAFELFVNGVHEGTVRFEVGDSSLEPEISVNLEAGARYVNPHGQAGISVFRNVINKFIYLFPTGQTDQESGFEIFENRQADATLIGAEFFGEVRATKLVAIRGGVDVLRGENNETDRPLPLMPANRIKLGATLSQTRLGSLVSPFFSADVKVVAKQDRIEEFETESEGYTLLDVGAGFEIPMSGGRITVDAGVENLLDESYRDHLSRYKEYALNPGRNITLKVSVPFTLVE